jgi:hypothetical protein
MARKIKVTTKKLDDLFRDIMRAQGRCHRCGRGWPQVVLQCAHGFSRRYRGTRWDEDANFCLCSGCHFYFTHRPIEWDDYMENVWGEEKYWRFRLQAQKITKIDKQELYSRLKARLEELNASSAHLQGREDEEC